MSAAKLNWRLAEVGRSVILFPFFVTHNLAHTGQLSMSQTNGITRISYGRILGMKFACVDTQHFCALLKFQLSGRSSNPDPIIVSKLPLSSSARDLWHPWGYLFANSVKSIIERSPALLSVFPSIPVPADGYAHPIGVTSYLWTPINVTTPPEEESPSVEITRDPLQLIGWFNLQ
jgi:hypothetical protein